MDGYPVPNGDYIITGVLSLVVAATPQQLPDIEIPADFRIAIKSYFNNPFGGLILIARSPSDVLNRLSSWPLIPNEVYACRVKNAKSLWISATAVPAQVVYSVEQYKR